MTGRKSSRSTFVSAKPSMWEYLAEMTLKRRFGLYQRSLILSPLPYSSRSYTQVSSQSVVRKIQSQRAGRGGYRTMIRC